MEKQTENRLTVMGRGEERVRCMDRVAWHAAIHGVSKSRTRLSDWTELNEMDEPKAYYTEWRKSEREKQILYTNTYIWNLGQWYWWNYLQGISGDPDIENRLMDTVEREEGKDEMNGESSMEAYTLPYKKHSQWEFAIWLGEAKLGLCNDLEG